MFCRKLKEGAFTRLELVALVAGVGLIALLSLPLRAGNTDHSRTSRCLDNMRRLAASMSLYALDHEWLPPNAEDGGGTGGTWLAGNAGPGGASEFDSEILRSPRDSLLFPYLESGSGVRVFACPADERTGVYRGSDPLRAGLSVPVARSVALNGAVGMNPRARVRQPVDGPWLDNQHGHTYGRRWRTYGKPEHMVGPSPSGLFTFVDEDAKSINDAVFANGMQVDEWIDWPSTRHDTSGTFAFGDGHAEVRRWVDPRTVVVGEVTRKGVPRSVDVLWLRERTSAELPR